MFFEEKCPKKQFEDLYQKLNRPSGLALESIEEKHQLLETMLSITEETEDKAFAQKAIYQQLALFQHMKVPFKRSSISRLGYVFLKNQQKLDPICLSTENEKRLNELYKQAFFTCFARADHQEMQPILEELVTYAKELASHKAYRRAHEVVNMIIRFTHPDSMDAIMRRNVVRSISTYAEKSGDKLLIKESAQTQIGLMDELRHPFDLPCYTRAVNLLFNQVIETSTEDGLAEKRRALPQKASHLYEKLAGVLSAHGIADDMTLKRMKSKMLSLDERRINTPGCH